MIDSEQRLAAWVEECVELRKKLQGVFSNDDGPAKVHEALLRARAVLDRVEEIVVTLTRLKGRTHSAYVTARHALKEAEDAAYTKRSVGFGEYVTGRERDAWASTQTVTERLEFKRLERLDSEVGAALEACKIIFRGIDGVRRDADTRLRFMTFERQLER